MVSIKHHGGFTLVEITIVMAITTALVAAAFIGQASIRAKYSFATGLERLESSIQQVKTESYSTQYVSPAAGTGNDAFFAKAIMFNTASPTTLTVYTILRDFNQDNVVISAVNPDPASTISVPNGLSIMSNLNPSASSVCIVFAQTNTAEPQGYSVTNCTPARLTTYANYDTAATTPNVRVKFKDVGDDNDGWVDVTTGNLTISSLVTK